MEVSKRLQAELLPDDMDKVCRLLEKTCDVNVIYADDFKRFIFSVTNTLILGTELCSLFIKLLNHESPIVWNAFEHEMSIREREFEEAFQRIEQNGFSVVPRVPDTSENRAFINFVMVSVHRMAAIQCDPKYGRFYVEGDNAEHGTSKNSRVKGNSSRRRRKMDLETDTTLGAIKKAINFASLLIQPDPFYAEEGDVVLLRDFEDSTEMQELSEICIMSLLHIRKITAEESLGMFIDFLVEEGWHRTSQLTKLDASKISEMFHSSRRKLEELKAEHHIAPQTQNAEDYDNPSDFLDFILARQTMPLDASAPPTLSFAEFVEQLRDSLVGKIAQEYGETPNRIANGNVWCDPNCVSIGEESLVDALVKVRSLANPPLLYYDDKDPDLLSADNVRRRRLDRMESLWHDRVIPIKSSTPYKKYYYPDGVESVMDKLDPLQTLQHDMLMRRTARLLRPKSRRMLVDNLAAMMQSKSLDEDRVYDFYSSIIDAFGPHYAVVEPFFETLLPHVCIETLQNCDEQVGQVSADPKLVMLESKKSRFVSESRANLEAGFQHFLECQSELEPPIRSSHIKRPMLRSIPPQWWERLRETMMSSLEDDEGAHSDALSENELDSMVRAVLKAQQDARRRSLGTLKLDAGHASGLSADEDFGGEAAIIGAVSGSPTSIDFINDSLSPRRVILMGIPPYTTRKKVMDALPTDESEIEDVEIHGDNFKNAMNTLKRSMEEAQLTRSEVKALRVKSVNVSDKSRAFAIVTFSSPETCEKAKHKYLRTFGAKVHAKFYRKVKKDPNNIYLKRQLKGLMGTQVRRRVVYDRVTGKPRRRGKSSKIVTRVVKGVGGAPIHDPIIPNELIARCRISEATELKELFVKGFQTGLSGHEIGKHLSKILPSDVLIGPIADLNQSGMGSITNTGTCRIRFLNHTMAQAAKTAISEAHNKGQTQLLAKWSMPEKLPGEVEAGMAKRVWRTIKAIKKEQHASTNVFGEPGLEQAISKAKKEFSQPITVD